MLYSIADADFSRILLLPLKLVANTMYIKLLYSFCSAGAIQEAVVINFSYRIEIAKLYAFIFAARRENSSQFRFKTEAVSFLIFPSSTV